MSDLAISVFQVKNEYGTMVPSINFGYIEKDTGAEWTITAGGTRVYLVRKGENLHEDWDDQSADSNFMFSRVATALFLSGFGLFVGKSVGRVFIDDIVGVLSITSQTDAWRTRFDDKEVGNQKMVDEFYDWYEYISINTLFRRVADDIYFSLLYPLETYLYLYRAMEWMKKIMNVGYEIIGKYIGVSKKDMKRFKQYANTELGQRHASDHGNKLRISIENTGSMAADFLYAAFRIRKENDAKFKMKTEKEVANIIFAACPAVSYP